MGDTRLSIGRPPRVAPLSRLRAFLAEVAAGSVWASLALVLIGGVGLLARAPGVGYVVLLGLFQAAAAAILLTLLALVRPRRPRLGRAVLLGSSDLARSLRGPRAPGGSLRPARRGSRPAPAAPSPRTFGHGGAS